MCRSIKTLYNYNPPATDEEIRAAALQFVRKISGYRTPSKINEAAFNRGVQNISKEVQALIESLQTSSSPRKRI